MKNIFFVLVNPEESKNIGSVCRALKNMNFFNVRIVGNKNNYDENNIKTLALEAFDVWEHALFFDSLASAVADCSIVAATTRRMGKKRLGNLLTPENFALQIKKNAKTAIVFGNERTGLTEEQINQCTQGICIPTNPEFGSLNLSHAVQIIAYVLFRTQYSQEKQAEYADIAEINKTVCVMTNCLEDMGFYKVDGKEMQNRFWRNIFSRNYIQKKEAEFIENIFYKIKALFLKK